jgi:hypothetical protein
VAWNTISENSRNVMTWTLVQYGQISDRNLLAGRSDTDQAPMPKG